MEMKPIERIIALLLAVGALVCMYVDVSNLGR
jgi:hypothetical protein